MKKFCLFVFFLLVTGFTAACAGALYLYRMPGPLTDSSKIVLLPAGSGVLGMGAILERENVISSRLIFAGFARLTGKSRSLKAGEYEFGRGTPMDEVLDKTARGEIYHRRFTIVEGKTSYEIVKILDAVPALNGAVALIPAEGTLLPETYDYRAGDDRTAMLTFMAGKMRELIETEWEKRDPDLPLTTAKDALTLASIVEKETGIASERARVAGVFVNRLKIGMPLQSDPTVIYGLTQGQHRSDGQGPLGRRLLRKDLLTANPYNTYLNPGLPPGPIANPGAASIRATLHPERHDYLFFVADGTGGHVFASTLSEHNRNVAAWRSKRKSGTAP